MKNPDTSLKSAKAAASVKERRILKFLNNAKKPEEIAAMLDTGDWELSMSAARKVINYRTRNGRFKSLKEVAGIPQLAKDRFGRLLSRFSDIETTLPTMAVPTFLLDGQERDTLRAGIIEFSIQECKTHGPRCAATFINWDPASPNPEFLWSDRSVLDFGKTLMIQARAGLLPVDIFKGCITGMKAEYPGDGPPRVIVTAGNPHEVQMKMARRTRTFENVSDGNVIQIVANEHGLLTDTDDQGGWHEVLVQTGQSDMEFIQERARAIGADVRVEGDTLRVRSSRVAGTTSMTFTYGRQLTEFSVKADLEDQITSVTAFAWSPSSKEMNWYRAEETGIWEDGQKGSDILRETLTEANEEIMQAGATDEELRVLAETMYREAALRFVRGSGVITGYAGLRVGDAIRLNGMGTIFSGSYWVKNVTLTYTPGDGFRTHFDVERSVISAT